MEHLLHRTKKSFRPSKPRGGRQSLGLALEALEDRTVPTTINWINPGSGNWDAPANWSTGSLPGSADDVVINTSAAATITVRGGDTIAIHSLTTAANDQLSMTGGFLQFTADSTMGAGLSLSNGLLSSLGNLSIAGAYTQTGGVLTGPGSVTVAGPLYWVSGTMSGSGNTTANGGLQLGVNDGQDHSQNLSARSFVNAGPGTVFSGNTFNQNASAVFTNAAGATIDLQGATLWNGADHSNPLINNGTLTVNAATASTTFECYYLNDGAISINSGYLRTHDGGAGSGSIALASGTTLQLIGYSDDTSFHSPASVTGAGTVQLDGNSYLTMGPGTTYNVTGNTLINGELILNNGSATLGSLSLAGGELTGSAAVTVTGLTLWTGGTMTGSGSTDAKGSLHIGMPDAVSTNNMNLFGRAFVNEGTGTWYANSRLTQQDGSTFTNSASATLTLQGAPAWAGGSSSSRVLNQGTITFAGAGTTLVDVYFNNSGLLQIVSGTFGLGEGAF